MKNILSIHMGAEKFNDAERLKLANDLDSINQRIQGLSQNRDLMRGATFEARFLMLNRVKDRIEQKLGYQEKPGTEHRPKRVRVFETEITGDRGI